MDLVPFANDFYAVQEEEVYRGVSATPFALDQFEQWSKPGSTELGPLGLDFEGFSEPTVGTSFSMQGSYQECFPRIQHWLKMRCNATVEVDDECLDVKVFTRQFQLLRIQIHIAQEFADSCLVTFQRMRGDSFAFNVFFSDAKAEFTYGGEPMEIWPAVDTDDDLKADDVAILWEMDDEGAANIAQLFDQHESCPKSTQVLIDSCKALEQQLLAWICSKVEETVVCAFAILVCLAKHAPEYLVRSQVLAEARSVAPQFPLAEVMLHKTFLTVAQA